MTPEERKAKDAARKREAYARRKKAEAELSNKLPLPQEAALKIAQAHGIDVQQPKPPSPYEYTPTPEHEERWRTVQTDGKSISAAEAVAYVDSREKAEAVQADSIARFEYVNHLFSKYEKNTNIPQLLQGIIREQIETRVVLIDLLAEILNEVRK